MEVYILYKESDPIRKPDQKNERGRATSSEAAPEYFGTKWHFGLEDHWILKYHE